MCPGKTQISLCMCSLIIIFACHHMESQGSSSSFHLQRRRWRPGQSLCLVFIWLSGPAQLYKTVFTKSNNGTAQIFIKSRCYTLCDIDTPGSIINFSNQLSLYKVKKTIHIWHIYWRQTETLQSHLARHIVYISVYSCLRNLWYIKVT